MLAPDAYRPSLARPDRRRVHAGSDGGRVSLLDVLVRVIAISEALLEGNFRLAEAFALDLETDLHRAINDAESRALHLALADAEDAARRRSP